MSYQTSIHFDPTSLLIIKNEILHTLQQVETTVGELVEEQSLPFGIEDAAQQFEQTAKVLDFIHLPQLSKMVHYSVEIMRQVMARPDHIDLRQITALSESTTVLKRYIEFICLREIHVPQFLLDTLNQLEIALKLPLTSASEGLVNQIHIPHLHLEQFPHFKLEQTRSIPQLYRLCLKHLIQQTETEHEFSAIRFIGAYLADQAAGKPSEKYWQLVYIACEQMEDLILSDARLRILIHLERQITAFLDDPDRFQAEDGHTADILTLCISQETTLSHSIRQQLQISDQVLTDLQLQIYSRQLFGPDQNTIESVTQLITDEINQIRNDIEFNYQNMAEDRMLLLQHKLIELANIFKVMNLNEAYLEFKYQADHLNPENMQKNPRFAQRLMNSLLSAMNSIGILRRNFSPARVQLDVNNMNISLDRLDEAHQILINETKLLMERCCDMLVDYAEQPEQTSLQYLPDMFRELTGAALFLDAPKAQEALKNSLDYLEQVIQQTQRLEPAALDSLLEVLASLDLLVEQLQTGQPVLESTFNIALQSSHQLKAIA